MEKIELDIECKACNGTGIYVGVCERDGSGVVCHRCNGTGCHHYEFEYVPFVTRHRRRGIKRVFSNNSGIVIGEGNGHKLEDFGGMPYKDWLMGKPFPAKDEMRKFVCPAWWYQTVDYDKKPEWCHDDYGFISGAFSDCPQFCNKSECWARWDKEYRGE